MSYRLSKNQKDQLLQLLSPNDPELLFNNIEYMMKTSFLPKKGKRENLIKKQVQTFKAIAKSARKLGTQLNLVDPFFMKSLNSKLGSELNIWQAPDFLYT
jgi:hypothetical protein